MWLPKFLLPYPLPESACASEIQQCYCWNRKKKICGNFGNSIAEIGEGKKKFCDNFGNDIAEIGEEKKIVAILAMPLPK